MFDETNEIDDLFAGGGKGPAGIPLTNIGDMATGIIYKMERLEERDDSGAVKLNDYGKPKPLFVAWIMTDLRDPENPNDDGARRIWFKGNALYELKQYLRDNGLGAPKVGGTVWLKLVGTKPSGKPKPMKLHAAKYAPATPQSEAAAYAFAAKQNASRNADPFGSPVSGPPAAQGYTTLDSMRAGGNGGFSGEAPF